MGNMGKAGNSCLNIYLVDYPLLNLNIYLIKINNKYNIPMNKNLKIKLFDELVISEYDLSTIIKSYVFHRQYYERELKNIGITTSPRNRDKFNKLVIANKDTIKFRTKNIIFLGYSNKEHNRYYFMQLTTKKKEYCKQSLYFRHIKGHSVYVNTNKVYCFNFDKQHVWSSKFNTNKSKIIQETRWKATLLNTIPRKIIKSLAKRTNLEIYKIKTDEFNILDSLDII